MNIDLLSEVVKVANKEMNRKTPSLRHICIRNAAYRVIRAAVMIDDMSLMFVSFLLSTTDKKIYREICNLMKKKIY